MGYLEIGLIRSILSRASWYTGGMDFSSSNPVIVVAALVVSITVHEMMHAFTAHWLGDDTAHEQGRVSLNPLKHIDPFLTIVLPVLSYLLVGIPFLAAKPVPFNPYKVKFGEFGAALVGLAGPLTNLALAIIAGTLLRAFGISMNVTLFNALIIFTKLNIALFVFNMIPIPPLDGSRLLYAFAPEPVQEVMAQLERYGIFIVFALVFAVPAFSTILININQAILRIIV